MGHNRSIVRNDELESSSLCAMETTKGDTTLLGGICQPR